MSVSIINANIINMHKNLLFNEWAKHFELYFNGTLCKFHLQNIAHTCSLKDVDFMPEPNLRTLGFISELVIVSEKSLFIYHWFIYLFIYLLKQNMVWWGLYIYDLLFVFTGSGELLQFQCNDAIPSGSDILRPSTFLAALCKYEQKDLMHL